MKILAHRRTHCLEVSLGDGRAVEFFQATNGKWSMHPVGLGGGVLSGDDLEQLADAFLVAAEHMATEGSPVALIPTTGTIIEGFGIVQGVNQEAICA